LHPVHVPQIGQRSARLAVRLRPRAIGPALALGILMGIPPRASAGCEAAVDAIEKGFGAPGGHAVAVEEVENPAWGRRPVTLLRPSEEAGSPWPVVFFAHGFGATQPLHYRQLVEHVASRGFAVVYAPYPTVAVAHERRYQVLWAGLEAALDALGPRADRTRMGFLGHSYGGGATPSLAHRALVERGWGGAGAFVMVMAPWYVLGVEPAQLAELPPHTRLLVQVYDRERINDHQIAVDLFDDVRLPADQKAFVTLRSDERDGCRLSAGHTTPATDGIRGELDALDHHGVFRLVDALAADALLRDPSARRVALGSGHPEHVEMGHWRDGTPVRQLTSTGAPTAQRPPEGFRFRAGSRELWIHADDIEF
jgi:hypothetical protein